MKILLLLAGLLALPAHAAVSAIDDAGHSVTLARPAQRVISLAPHATELIYAAGGGARMVGAVSYSDYPPAALKLPRIGDNRQLDLERIIALKPDLLVVWLHGNAERQLAQLKKLGIPLFYSEPKKLADIPGSLTRLGHLLGSEAAASTAATRYQQRLDALGRRYGKQKPVKVFYQVWHKPLYTLNNSHIASDAIRLCGGINVFGQLPLTAPTVNVEAVLAANPDVIVAGSDDRRSTELEMWKRYPTLNAARHQQLYTLDSSLLSRSGPRILDGATLLCEKLDQARQAKQP
ncbi:cobalamin-binding protein [Craterilacuibacter sp. RT1T]|uniref:cobalamin-binding protein n=1 Tax=Craterilacuibacter sp. RT1T TaxID=2942211 RepID=UPI0020BD53D8|nr:cobalamin-binding protein [Craterilacuibacter sp. RT1T]MCL6264190.1 cobalamin-binding protein [Craterilacuibacter sp. RT1T]